MAALKGIVMLVMAVLASPAGAALSQRDLTLAVAHPASGARLPARLAFIDQRGVPATLADVAGGRPLVLLFADYTCSHICGPGVTLAAAALHETGLVAGRDYVLAVIGLDPRDGLDAARRFGERITEPDVTRATRLLVGSAGSVTAAERALGYGIAYDSDTDQFAHDASVYVFGSDGRLVTLLPELGLRPEPLRAALAGRAEAPSVGERIARLCYGLGAAHGRYGAPVVLALQALAAMTLAALATVLWRRRRA